MYLSGWEMRNGSACRSAPGLADDDSHALGVPDLAANQVLGEWIVQLRLTRAPRTAGNSIGIVGHVVPGRLQVPGRVGEGVPADPDGRVPRAADAGAGGLGKCTLALQVSKVLDTFVDPVPSGMLATVAILLPDLSVGPTAGLEATVVIVEVIVRVDLVDLLHDLFDSAIEGEGLALWAEVTREGGLADFIALGNEIVDVVVGVNRGSGGCSL